MLLGDPRLYEQCQPVLRSELSLVQAWIDDLDNVMHEIRTKYNFGRAIAAPQLGIMKRLIYMNIDEPVVFINPEFTYMSKDKIELWDDCMSFPNLHVFLKRHRYCKMRFRDLQWKEQTWNLADDLSELMQHECDHLDGVLATMRAEGEQAFRWVR